MGRLALQVAALGFVVGALGGLAAMGARLHWESRRA